jgi:hypothetical protein
MKKSIIYFIISSLLAIVGAFLKIGSFSLFGNVAFIFSFIAFVFFLAHLINALKKKYSS